MDPVQKKIDDLLHEHDVVLFMKGTPQFPQCGFSQRMAGLLQAAGAPYSAINVLLDDAIREGVKVYANWPTIPQLYVNGKFIGGCDIVSEMYESGELATLLEPFRPEVNSSPH